jgi:endonuclease/exonuclease/phosphatase family metal-dependent hydrolase
VVLPGLELSVAVTHLQHRPRSNARPQLELVLETLSMRPGPHLLLGDLNLAAGEAVPLLEAAGFTPAPVGFTSPRRAPREQIDWIACRDLSVVHAEVHEPLVSDHLPVVATLATLPAGS